MTLHTFHCRAHLAPLACIALALAGCAHEEAAAELPPEVSAPVTDVAEIPTAPVPTAPVEGLEFQAVGAALTATHPVHDMRVQVALDLADGAQIRIGPREGDAALGLRLSTIGTEPALPATVSHEGNRVVLDRGAVREWYVHEARGLEQGFTVASRPLGGLELWMELETDYEVVQLDEDTVELHRGSLLVRYAGLFVRDADGRELDASILLGEGRLGLRVDDTGARYPVEIDPLISIEQKLVAGDAATNDQFGHEVAIDGDTAIVGAHSDDVGGLSNAGSAYVFVRSGGVWTLQQKLSAGVAGEFFGGSVAIEGDTAVIGAPNAAGLRSGGGAVYVYVRSGTVWTQQARLIASTGSFFDSLGESVSVSGDTLLAGASDGNYACIYVRSGTTWTEQAQLLASDRLTGDWFGYSVSLDGDTALVGAFSDDTAAGTSAGSAYVFVRTAGTWSEQAHLFASDALPDDELGKAVALSGNTAFVGAPSDDHAVGSLAGSAYVFERVGTVWTQRAKLVPVDVTAGDQFGASLSVDGTTAIVGAHLQASGAILTVGAAYVYSRVGGVWTQDIKLRATDGVAGDVFGSHVAISGGNVLVGAALDTHGALADAGSAYTYRIIPVGQACAIAADCASGFCVDGVCCDAACGGGPSDCQACSIAAGASRDGFCETLASTRTCRAASGTCDVAEQCDGSTAACPADGFTMAGVVCRAAPGACDVAETCTGASPACPPDGFAGTSTVCRPSAGVCDVADTCSGSSATCPTNVFVAAGTGCRAAVDLCDAPEACTGGSAACPSDGLVASGTQCRAPAGACDVAEACSGSSTACPSDGFAGAGTLCRGVADVCDVAERCGGGSALCPADAFATMGTACRAAAGPCDVAEACTGLAAACPSDGLVAAGVECRASMGICDVAEACTGSAVTCPPNTFVGAGTECRASMGICDVVEACTGASAPCPTNAFVAAGTECRASMGICDVAEACSGSSATCAPDAFAGATTVCRAASDVCDAVERCAGGVTCPPDLLAAAGTSCRPASGACDVAEACTGAGGACPADLFTADGAPCGNGLVCDGDEICTAGACAAPSAPECDDGDPCTADLCTEPGGCGESPIEGCCLADADCDDGRACTTDSCDADAHVCEVTPITGCCEVDADCDDGDSCTDDRCDPEGCVNERRPGCVSDGGALDGGALDGAVSDGAVSDAGSPAEIAGGCGCSVPRARAPSSALWLLALAVFLRRARRRGQPIDPRREALAPS